MLHIRTILERTFAQRFLWLILLLVSGGAGHGAEATNNPHAKLKPVPAGSNLVAAAALNKIPVGRMDALSGTNALRPGDSATMLVTFAQKGELTQWLLYLEAATPDSTQPAQKPAKFEINSAFGRMKFESKPAPVSLRLLGPFAVGRNAKALKAVETTAKFNLNEDFLGFGMDRAAVLMYRWSQQTNFDHAVTSQTLLAMNPTPEEQRAVCAAFPALLTYFSIVQHTDGLEDLLQKLVDPPSLWSIIRHVGVKVTLTFGDGAAPAAPMDWNLPTNEPAYYFPWLLRLNNQPALKITLVVTHPQQPLLICGGVVGLLAEKVGDDETYMTMRIIDARHRTSPKN